MMERRFAKFFHSLVHELIPDHGQRDQLFDSLRRYQSSQKLHQLLLELRGLLDEPDKLELFEYIRPLILLRHQMEYSYLAPAIPGVRLRTIRLHRAPGQSLGFAVRGGYEFNVGVFVSVVEPGSQAEKQGLKVGDEIVRVNGFTIAEAIHDDVLSLIKSRDEIILKVTHIGMLPVKEHASDSVTWKYVEDMDSKRALDEVLGERQVRRGKGVELKIFIDCTGYDSIGCGIVSGPPYYPGIFVDKVRPGSLAQEVGLEVGDQIVEVNESSFINIGHKEAVVVLKGSKQLNIIVRKHAGLPLFERRQTSRVSSNAPDSSRPPSIPSLPTSQRSASSSGKWTERGALDEGQLIAEQLSRSALFRKASSSTFSPPADSNPHQQSSEVRISTQAEVHSDSDSFHGSGGDGVVIPREELSPADNPPSVLTSPCTASVPLPSSLALPDRLDNPEHTTASLPLPADTATTSLSLPEDLGDPVFAVLRRRAYSPDIPAWVVPHTHISINDINQAESPDLDRQGDFHSSEQTVQYHDMQTGEADGFNNSLSAHAGSDVNDSDRVEKEVLVELGGNQGMPSPELEKQETAGNAEEVEVPTLKLDEDSSHVTAEGQRSDSDLEAVNEAGYDRKGSFGGTDSLGKRFNPPVFVPPPPPSSSPPSPHPSDWSSQSLPDSRRLSPTASKLSSTSTQMSMKGQEVYTSDDECEAVLEFGSEVDETSSVWSETQEGKGKQSEAILSHVSSRQGYDMNTGLLSTTGDTHSGENDIMTQPGNGSVDETGSAFTKETFPESMPGISSSLESSGVGHEELQSREVTGDAVLKTEAPVEVCDADSSGLVHPDMGDYDFPPPPPSFFEDEDDNEMVTSTLTEGYDGAAVTDVIPPLLDIHSALPTAPLPEVSASSSPPLTPPPIPPLSDYPVMGGAAAVLAARREAQEEEWSPRLLGPAEPGLSGVGLQFQHVQLAALFNPFELDGRELKAFTFPRSQTLGIELEGGMGTPLAGRIVVAAVFDGGAAVEHGLQTGDQLMMVNGRKLTDVTAAQAEQILEEAYSGPKELIQVVYTQSNFLNDEECVTYF